jgi:hypothetical protein
MASSWIHVDDAEFTAVTVPKIDDIAELGWTRNKPVFRTFSNGAIESHASQCDIPAFDIGPDDESSADSIELFDRYGKAEHADISTCSTADSSDFRSSEHVRSVSEDEDAKKAVTIPRDRDQLDQGFLFAPAARGPTEGRC